MTPSESQSIPLPVLTPPPSLHSFSRWADRYGYYVDEMVAYALERLPAQSGDGSPIVWDARMMWNELARLCYATSINRFKAYRPAI